ncbi:unnamed protein product [Amoebophrya sp. A25]|nr:unnamed protein product [Amoebophrya sp. A25]|eukprot:GSA25T00018788001.1
MDDEDDENEDDIHLQAGQENVVGRRQPVPLQQNDRVVAAQEPLVGTEQGRGEQRRSAEANRERMILDAADRLLEENFVSGVVKMGCQAFIRKKLCNPDATDVARVRKWFLLRINNQMWRHNMQSRVLSTDNIPVEQNYDVWPEDNERFPFLGELRKRFPAIRNEILSLRGRVSGFQPYRDPRPNSTEAVDHSESKEGTSSKSKREDLPGVSATSSGCWNVLYLYLNHKRFDDNLAQLPETRKAIEEVFPRHYSHAFVSALTPGTRIIPHFGPSNRMLRVWLPLDGNAATMSVEGGAEEEDLEEADNMDVGGTRKAKGVFLRREELRSGGTEVWRFGEKDSTLRNHAEEEEQKSLPPKKSANKKASSCTANCSSADDSKLDALQRRFPVALHVGRKVVSAADGDPFVWDHSYRHSAWNLSEQTRLVLIVDIWHPELSDAEIKFLSALQQAKLRMGRRLVEAHKDHPDAENNLIALVEKTKGVLTDDDWWVLNAEREHA